MTATRGKSAGDALARLLRRRLAPAVALLALMAAGCEDQPPVAQGSEPPPATEHCAVAESIPIQGQGHLVGDQEPPVPYNSTPPTSGWHTSMDVPTGVAEESLTEPQQVTVLEQGAIVITHNGLHPDERDKLEQLVSREYPTDAAVTSYGKIDRGTVTLTAWGALQRCDAVDPAAIATFIEAYAQQ